MNARHDGDLCSEPEIQFLHDFRPSLSPVRLDEIKREIQARPSSGTSLRWLTTFLRTRAALLCALAVGALMSSGGVAIAVSGTGSNGTANTAEYGNPGKGPSAGTLQGAKAVTPTQVVEQTSAASSGQLPFTGFAALGLIVIGVMIAGTGLTIRYVVTHPRRAPDR
jgi:hypothetical protein